MRRRIRLLREHAGGDHTRPVRHHSRGVPISGIKPQGEASLLDEPLRLSHVQPAQVVAAEERLRCLTLEVDFKVAAQRLRTRFIGHSWHVQVVHALMCPATIQGVPAGPSKAQRMVSGDDEAPAGGGPTGTKEGG